MSNEPVLQLPPGINLDKQPTNFSLASVNKFVVISNIFPDMAFWATKVVLPDIQLGANLVGDRAGNDYWTPGDKIVYGDLTITFLLEENLITYTTFKKWQSDMVNEEIPQKRFSTMGVFLLDNNSNPNHTFIFERTFPFSLSNIQLEAGQSEDMTLTMDVSFKTAGFTLTTIGDEH